MSGSRQRRAAVACDGPVRQERPGCTGVSDARCVVNRARGHKATASAAAFRTAPAQGSAWGAEVGFALVDERRLRGLRVEGCFRLVAVGQNSKSKVGGRPYLTLASSSGGCPLCLGT